MQERNHHPKCTGLRKKQLFNVLRFNLLLNYCVQALVLSDSSPSKAVPGTEKQRGTFAAVALG